MLSCLFIALSEIRGQKEDPLRERFNRKSIVFLQSSRTRSCGSALTRWPSRPVKS